MAQLGTDVPDELCEVAEICNGTSLISSTIVNRGVHHLHELRSIKVVVVFDLLPVVHLEGAFIFTAREQPSFQTEDEGETMFASGNIKNNRCGSV